MRWVVGLTATGLALLACGEADGCPNCREGLVAAGRAMAYAVSAAFLLALPFGIVAFWARLICSCRQSQR